jgi:hypothetical protein
MINFKHFILNDDIENLFSELDNYLENVKYIDPITGKGWRLIDRWRQLKSIVDDEVSKGTDIDKIWITFSDVRKFGQRTEIRYSKSTPVGIFAFPVKYALERKEHLPNTYSQRPYIHVFKTKHKHLELGGFEASNTDKDTDTDAGSSSNKFKKIKNQFPEFSNIKSVLINSISEDMLLLGEIVKPYYVYSFLQSFIYGQIKKIYSLINSHDIDSYQKYPFIANPYEAIKSHFNLEDYDERIKPLIQNITITIFQNGNLIGWVSLYENIGNDMSAQLNPKAIAAWNEEDNQRAGYLSLLDHINFPYHYEARKNPSQKIPLDEIERAVAECGFFDIGLFLAEKQLIQNPKAFFIFLNAFKKIKNEADRLIQLANTDADYEKFPYGKELKSYADKNGLDYKKAVRYAASHPDPEEMHTTSKTAYTGNQFVYRAAESLANQKEEKLRATGIKADWRAQWNKILRDLGIKSIADTKDSGHIHSGEPTQGVFMDPKDIIFIATIEQTSHRHKLDYSGRPQKKDWKGYSDSKEHERLIMEPSQPRSDIYIDPEEMKGKSSQERTEVGLQHRITQTLEEIQEDVAGAYTYQKHFDVLKFLRKLIISYNKLLDTGFDSKEYKNFKKDFIKTLDRYVSLQKEHSSPYLEEISEKVEEIKDILN